MAAAAAGEEELAREVGSRLLVVNPQFTIDRHFQLMPFRRKEDVSFMTDHLRTAGLPQ